jgi:hypothetical protein
MISRIAALKIFLQWAEDQDLHTVTTQKVEEATAGFLHDDQRMALNAGLWGFLAGSLSGTAETMFMGAEQLNGLDACPRVARQISHGESVRLETLRRQDKRQHTRVHKGS